MFVILYTSRWDSNKQYLTWLVNHIHSFAKDEKRGIYSLWYWLCCHSFDCCCHIANTWAATWQNQESECAPSEDSNQPGHLPSLIRVFAVRMKKAWVLSYSLSAQRILWSDWANAQADLSLRWAHTHFVGFVMSLTPLVFSLTPPPPTVDNESASLNCTSLC